MGATQTTSTVGAEAASPSATQTASPTATSNTQASTQGASPQSAQHVETKTSTSGSQETSQSASKASMGSTQTSTPLGSTTIQGRHIPEANYTHDAAAQARAAQAAQNIASRNLTNVSPTIQHVADRKVSSESIGQTFKRPDKRG